MSQPLGEHEIESHGGRGELAGRARVALLGLPPGEARESLRAAVQELNEPGYRIDQVLEWTWERRASGFDEMSNLPLALRDRLAERFELGSAQLAFEARSADGTLKHLWALEDGARIESVLIPSDGRITLCLSSQAGCALGCRFCATGLLGLSRQLTSAEIVEQFRNSELIIRRVFGTSIANVVYMGMGEPFANLRAVLRSLTVLNGGFQFGARRITVSTVGLIPGIEALAARREDFRLAVSLHAPDPDLRLALMPVERRYPLPQLIESVRRYQARKRRRVSFEYAMIRDVNDRESLARDLVKRLAGIASYVNLIPFNPVPGLDWKPSSAEVMASFAAVLNTAGIPAAIRTPRGRDIAAACGQLRLEREVSEPAG